MKDLRSFLDELRREHPEELVEVEREVDPRFEMSGLVMKLEKQGLSPAFLFKKVRGTRFPVVSNMHASFSRMAIALGSTEAAVGAAYRSLESSPRPPVEGQEGPVNEVVIPEGKLDLTKDLPNIVYHEKDGGPYIALGCLVMKDPELGHRNLGVYRIMIQGKRQLGVYFAQTSQAYVIMKKYEEAKKPMDVAVVIGHHPTFCIGSVANTPPGVDQYSVIGGIMGEPVRLTDCKAVDIEVPCDAEMVVEGVIPPGVREMEGPFGEFTGGYGPRTPRPVIQVKAITMRRDPIYQDAFSGHPDNLILGYFGRLNAIFRSLNQSVRTVREIHLPLSGRARFICYASIKKMREGEPKNACFAAFAADAFLKYAVVVDEGVNIRDDSEVMHAIAMWVRPDKDIFIVPNALGSPLDPTAEEGYIVAKVGIDATKKPGMPEMLHVPGYESMRIEDYVPAAALKRLTGTAR